MTIEMNQKLTKPSQIKLLKPHLAFGLAWRTTICPNNPHSVIGLLRSICQMRNSFCDSCNVTVKPGADLAETRKSQVSFAAFNSTKITSV